jgi:hypothetical protein
MSSSQVVYGNEPADTVTFGKAVPKLTSCDPAFVIEK